MTRTIFGVVTYSNESGPIKRVECETPEHYFRELNIGADWADSEPRRKLNVYGERTSRKEQPGESHPGKHKQNHHACH